MIIEDENSLEKKVNFSASSALLLFLLVAVIVVGTSLGIFLVAATPIKKKIPGYIGESERLETEQQHIRLDSLIRVYDVNEAYISGIINSLNPSDKVIIDSETLSGIPKPLAIDSLLPQSDEERVFIENIREREKYNIPYTAPAAAQTLMFVNVNNNAIISEDSKDKYLAQIILPTGGTIASIADGKVISVASSPKSAGGFEVIIQHPMGFLSKTGRLNNVLVRPGDKVSAGQIIATSSSNSGIKNNKVMLELWHDGDPLVPASYLN